ncbi:MAG: stage II sporulation protein M [Patescibacteria group bacterium]|nr:stage II sporulation protein M [Patescibacteria group bacterium]
MTLFQIKKYLYGLKIYILFSLYFFAISTLIGYIFAQNNPVEVREVIKNISEALLLDEEMTSLQLFFFIFQNNVSKLFIILPLGIFAGIIPFLSIFTNGLILGIFAQIAIQEVSWLFLIFGIMPHGIIEIPVLIVSSAIGMRIGKVAIWKLFGSKESLIKELTKALRFFIFVLFPLLFIAAFIETYITSNILKLL